VSMSDRPMSQRMKNVLVTVADAGKGEISGWAVATRLLQRRPRRSLPMSMLRSCVCGPAIVLPLSTVLFCRFLEDSPHPYKHRALRVLYLLCCL
jgi:hypothetical protein